jgi:signal transduction histidine kinase
MLAERRARSLCGLMAATASARSREEVLELSARTLAGAAFDVPFALFYSVDAVNGDVRLITGTPRGDWGFAAPGCSPLEGSAGVSAATIVEVARSNHAHTLENLQSLSCGPYDESPRIALALPIVPPGCEAPVAVLVAGTSARQPLTEAYRTFYHSLADSIAVSMASAGAYEEERRRAEHLAELDRMKTEFFSNVSHEFRTPITLLVGPLGDELAEVVQPLPGARRERLETAHRNALRLLNLVNLLLDFARIESGRMLANYRPTDLGIVTSELVSMFRSAIERAGLTLTLEIEPLPEQVYVDRDMWEKIVLNLMSNAFKHTFHGDIAVSLRCLTETVELEVADTGIGIAEDDMRHLFERFQRVAGARSRSKEGTGIGLALVRELTRLHGGEVLATSQLGRGAVFTVSLPRGKSHLPQANVGSEAAGLPGGAGVAACVQEALLWAAPSGAIESSPAIADDAEGDEGPERTRKSRVLLVDDNSDMREYVARLLGGNYEVHSVADGQAALESVASNRPDLVLTDVMMPGLDGFGLLRALRANPVTTQLPVILLSARAGEDSAVEGLEAGADDYLIKPFSARELSARVRTHLELARARRQWAEHLEQANQELEAFSYSVSHDLRAPLRAIDGFSRVVLARNAHQLDEQGKGYLLRVRAAAARMSELIDELLNLSRVSRVPIRRQSVDLSAIARTVAFGLQEHNAERRVEVTVEEGLHAQVDPRLLQIVFENLLGNSWKFTARRADAKVRVGQLTGRDVATYFVQDNGAGFDAAYKHRLFQPFQRLHSDSDFRGSGVGLAIVHRIVARHGGAIWAEGLENHGATFYFTLSENA